MTKQPIEYKNFSLEVKEVDEDRGIIRGYLSIFNNVDSQKDRVRPGAFKKTIADALQRKSNRGKKYLWPLLWMHDPEKPIGGFIDAVEDTKGLYVTAQLDISTNAQGIPNNPLATTVFSGYKAGYVDELSIGYKAIQKDYDNAGVRDLKELQLWEGSAVTMLFAANELAQVSDVKAASGSTSLPLADRNTPWSKSKAIKDVESVTGGDWSKASKYFFWSSANPTTEADHKLPFAAKVGGEMKAIPQGIISAAGVIQGAMGGANIDDVEGVKAKIAAYYRKMDMTPPWEDKEKSAGRTLARKDFNDRYREECIKDWLYSDFQNLTCALRCAAMEIFAIGDEPQADAVNTILNDSDDNKTGFISAFKMWVQKGIDLDVSNYLAELQQSSPYQYQNAIQYMTTGNKDMEKKAGARFSQDSSNAIQQHADQIKAVANHMQMQHKAMMDTAQALQADGYTEHVENIKAMANQHMIQYKALVDTADALTELVGSPATGPAYGTDAPGKSNEPRTSVLDTQPFDNTDLDLLASWLSEQLKQKA